MKPFKKSVNRSQRVACLSETILGIKQYAHHQKYPQLFIFKNHELAWCTTI